MKSKFEICENCPIESKDECLIAFGSIECIRILINQKSKMEWFKITVKVFCAGYDTVKRLEHVVKHLVERNIDGELIKQAKMSVEEL